MMALIGAKGLGPGAIAEVLGGEWLAHPPEGSILGVSIDTRTLRAGEMFFALRGENTDGHDYLDQAASAGCPLAVVDRADIETGGLGSMGVLCVARVRTAPGTLARAYRRALPGLCVIGVTGSNGKTTTVRLLHAALSGTFPGTCSEKSFNNELGLPLTLLNAKPGDAYVICEMGSSNPGEIARLAAIARPDIGIITSIGRSHLETFGSVARVAQEKADLVRALPRGGLALVCAGSAELDSALGGDVACELIRVGIGPDTDLRVTGIRSDRDGVTCEVSGTRVRVPTPGVHNAVNAAMAIVAAGRLGVEPGGAAAGIASAQPPPMRLERTDIRTPRGVVHMVNDAYNSNPESSLAAIGLLASGDLDPAGWDRAGRRIAVLGEMLEQGDAAAEVHDELAGGLTGAGDAIDGVMLIGAHAGRMAGVIEAARAGSVLFVELDSGSDWPRRAGGLLRGGDVVLLKGSRGMRLERLVALLTGAAR